MVVPSLASLTRQALSLSLLHATTSFKFIGRSRSAFEQVTSMASDVPNGTHEPIGSNDIEMKDEATTDVRDPSSIAGAIAD